MLQSEPLTMTGHDKWISTIGKGDFRPSSVYKQHFPNIDNHPPSCLIWKSKCMPKHKFFLCLIPRDRINTKDMLLRWHWNVTNNHDYIMLLWTV